MKEYIVTVPASPGPGPATPVGDASSNKTVHYKGSSSDYVYLELSADGLVWVRDPNFIMAGSSPAQKLSCETMYVRAYRSTGTGGTFTCSIVAEQLSAASVTPLAVVIEAETAASQTTGARPFGQVRGSRRVAAVTLVPQGAVAADANHYASVSVVAKSSAGAERGVVAVVHTGAAGWTAYNNVNLQLGTYLGLVDLDSLCLMVGKAGTGAQLPQFALLVHFE